ncbi:hypothetical protein B0H19DRAFT_1030031 [Mycena capillaripes]|nr:hypothetical protein B0H19DRAFT_1030031 [Mycena capillaripes]
MSLNAAGEMMRDNPEQVFASHKSWTAEEILLVTQAWKEKQEIGAAVTHGGMLQTLLHHINGRKVPKTVKPPTVNDLSDRAWSSLAALEGGFVSEFPTNPELRTQLISASPGIFKWCRYFYDQRVSAEKDPGTAEKTISTLSTGILHFYTDATVRATIRATPGIITLCTRLCLHPAASGGPFTLLSLLHADTWDDKNEIVAAAGGKPEVIARILLDRLRLAVNKSLVDGDKTSTLASILTTFISLPNHPLAFAILADTGTWLVARMLFLVSQAMDLSDSLEQREKYSPCIRTGITFLRGAMVQYDSPRLVSQAVDAGLLRAICALSPVLDGDLAESKPSLRFILRDILPKSMMYRSVIKVMKSEHKEIDPDEVNETIMRSYLREEWMSFVVLLYSRITIAKFPKELKVKGNTSCDSVTCSKKGPKSEFRRCSGCLYVYYCSKECQKEAWPIHRDMCRLKKSSIATGGSPMFSEQDAQFLREVISADAHIHHPHLQKLARRKFPNEPQENLIICIDYTNPLYPAGTCSLKNIKTYVFPPVSDEAADPANVRAQNAEMMKRVRQNPREYTFIEATFAYGQQRLARNLMLRPNMLVQPVQKELHSALNWQNNKCENQDGPAEGLLELFLAMNVRYADL